MKKLLLTLTLVAPIALQAKKVDQDFLKAVTDGNIKKAKIALDYGAYINAMNNEGYTALHLAVKGKYSYERTNYHLLKLLLDKGADVDEVATSNAYETPLQLAAQKGDILATYFLLAYGAQDTPTGYWNDEKTARNYALENGHNEVNALLLLFNQDYYWESNYYGPQAYASVSQDDYANALEYVVDELIWANIDLSIPNPQGETLLHYAIKLGSIKVTQDLLEHGADIQAQTTYGITPLHSAAKEDQLEIVELLLAAGAEANAQDDHGKTPLHYATKWTPATSQLVKILLEHGAKVTIEDNRGKTPLMTACYAHISHTDFIKVDEAERTRSHVEIINLLLQYGASADERSSKNGCSSLHELFSLGMSYYYGSDYDNADEDTKREYDEAEKNAHEEYNKRVLTVAQLLVDNGADVNALCKKITPLHLAYHKEHVAFLLSQGAKVHATNKDGQTPLHRCAPEAVHLLIQHGAVIDAVDNNGDTPLLKMVADLRKASYTWDMDYARQSHEKIMLLLLHGASIHHKNIKGETALHYVYFKETAQLLLDHGANLYELDNEGNTVLHSAAYRPLGLDYETREYDTSLIQFLIDSGSLVNQQNAQGETPLHVAARDCIHVEKIQCLLDNGADPFIEDTNGDTPVQVAEQQEYLHAEQQEYLHYYDVIDLLCQSMN